ncbi:MAG: hypothetical protein RR630_03880 [Coprobacillus sp.]
MKKILITISCLGLVFLLGMVVLDSSHTVLAAQPTQNVGAMQQDKEIIITTDNVQKTDNTVKQTTCPYNHENCDGTHQNKDCPNNHESCNGNCQNQQGTNCNNANKQGFSRGKHHRNGF